MRKTTFLSKLSEIEIIIKKCQVCYVAMVDQSGKPYVLPFNFGYSDGTVYLHSDVNGKKMDILKNNPSVCIKVLIRSSNGAIKRTRYTNGPFSI